MMNMLVMEHVSKIYGDKTIFHDVSLGINEGEKIGVIGINGTGKSTLLKMLAGLVETDEGTIIKGRNVKVAYLPQMPEFTGDPSILEYVMAGHGASAAEENESTARSILTRLGFEDWNRTTAGMSGGERKRVALAKALLNPVDILIMDEPTNHLDSDMVLWLEEYLDSYKGVLVMVTHDRYFLDRVTNKIVEIDQANLYVYEDTNYSGYLEKRQERIETSLAADQKRANILRTELAWLHRGARARSTKQKAHIQRIEEMQSQKNTVLDKNVVLDSVASRMGKKTIELQGVGKCYGDRVLFRDFNYIVLRGERIGIIGPNGCGKSTLMKIITGLEAPSFGDVVIGDTIRIGYFAQENEDMDTNIRVIDYVRNVAEIIRTSQGTATASQMLERFLFPPALQYTPVNLLSGGEKRRLYLLRVLMTAPNVLILDEPTNDLDIATLSTLEDYLDHFDGIVITVSHDRYFLDRMVNRIFAFEGEQIVQYEGGFTDYYLSPRRPENRAKAEEAAAQKAKTETSRSSASDAGRSHEKKLAFTYKEKKEFETIDDDIAALEEKMAALEEEMQTCASQYARLTELQQEKEECEAALEEKMDRWVYLNDLAEQIEAQK